MQTRSVRAATLMLFGTLCAASAGVERISVEEGVRAREAAAEVLAQPEFRRVHDDSRSWTEWMMDKLKSMAAWLHDRLWELPVWLSWLIIVWMLLTLVAILAHIVYIIISQFGTGSGRRPGRRAAQGRVYGVRKESFEAVLAKARMHFEAGRWAAAVRYFYVAAILWLDRHGKVHFRESKTNHDYIRELAPHADAQQRFRTLTQSFDVTVYGGQAPTENTCQAMVATLESLRSEVGSADQT
jgi:hypothetical protein